MISDLIERAFPNLGLVLLKDEEEFTHIGSLVLHWVTEVYNSLLDDYPEKQVARSWLEDLGPSVPPDERLLRLLGER